MTGRSSFRYTRSVTLVPPWPTKCAISSMVTPELDSKDTKLCRNSRGVHSLGFSPAALATRRNERRTLAASSADPCRVQNTKPSSFQDSSASRRILSRRTASSFGFASVLVFPLAHRRCRLVPAPHHGRRVIGCCVEECLPGQLVAVGE